MVGEVNGWFSHPSKKPFPFPLKGITVPTKQLGTPPFSVHSYGTTWLRKSANTTRTAWASFFFLFFLSRSNDDLHFLHTQNCCRINPHGATVSFTLLGTPVFPHMRRVKYGVFKNVQKILKIKLKSFSWCQKMQNSPLFTNLKERKGKKENTTKTKLF